MSTAAVKEALGLIRDHPEYASFVGPRDPGLIVAAERALNFKFPASYREFVSSLGAGSFGSFEIYGIVDNNFEQSAIPDAVWLVLQMYRHAELAENLLPIGDLGYGGYYCIERRDSDHPIVVVEHGTRADRGMHELVAPDFGSYFLQGVRDQLLKISN